MTAKQPKQPTPDPDADAPEGEKVDPLGTAQPVGAEEGDTWQPSEQAEKPEHDDGEQTGGVEQP